MIVDAFKETVFRAIGFTPHPRQWQASFTTAHHRLIVAGRRWGKSTKLAAAEVTTYAMMSEKTIWCVAPTYDLARKVFRPVYSNCVNHLGLPIVRKSLGDLLIEFPWGTTIQGKSTDNPDSCVGEGVHLMVIDELARVPERTFKTELMGTLLDTNGRLLGITTPHGPGYVQKMFEEGLESPDWFCLRSPSWENPYLRPEAIDALARVLGGRDSPYFRQEVGAEFVVFAGLVYTIFIPDVHVRKPPPISQFAEFYGGIDWGYSMPFVFLLFGRHRETGAFWLLRTVYKTELTIDDQVGQTMDAIRSVLPAGRSMRRVWAGPDQPGSIKSMRKAGIPCVPAEDAVEEGILSCVSLIGAGHFFVAEGGIGNDEFVREMGLYRRPDRKLETQAPTEKPLKRDDHSPDAFRYFAHNVLPFERRGLVTDILLGDRRVTADAP